MGKKMKSSKKSLLGAEDNRIEMSVVENSNEEENENGKHIL